MNGLTWLHLSDWHQRGRDFDREVVRDALLRDLRKRAKIDPRLGDVSFVVFSGDAAFAGKTEEFEAARAQLFAPVLEVLGLSPQNLLIVPGNHDLSREHVDEFLPPALKRPFQNDEQAQKWLTDKKRREVALSPFEDFARFVSGYTGQNPPAYANTWSDKIDGKTIGIVCLNSAWMCGRHKNETGENDDYGHLTLGEPQVYEALATINGADVRLAVLHHPFSWLAGFDRNRIKDRLKRECHFILHGHEHEPDFRMELELSGECALIPGGACYNRRTTQNPRYANAYNFVHLDFNAGSGVIFLRRWGDRQGEWIADRDSEEEGEFTFRLPKKLGAVQESSPAIPQPAPLSDAELLQIFFPYLRSVAHECSELVTWGIQITGNPTLRLTHVYAKLETGTKLPLPPQAKEFMREKTLPPSAWEFMREKARPLSAWDALFDPKSRWLVLTGEPGSGKSTLFQYITLFLADKMLGTQGRESYFAGVDVLDLPVLPASELRLPLRINLGKFSKWLSEEKKSGNSEAIVEFLESRLKKGDRPTKDHLRQVFQRGLALVLLDGLDEVLKNKLGDVRQTIAEFRHDYALCRIAVTCRIASYEQQQSEFKLDHFPDSHQITPLSPELQEWFVRAWYRELEIQHPQFLGREEAFASRLLGAIKNGELKEMAGNPFFLTAMASMNDKEKELPGNSAELMEKMVECILTESRKYQPGHNPNDEKPALAQLLAEISGGEKRLRSQLQTTAYKERIQRQNSTSRSVDIERLRGHLLLDDESKRKWVDQVVDALKQRAGLLQSKDGDTLEFAYRFEEYLAACYLADDDAWKLQSRQKGIKIPPVFARRVCDHLLTASIDASQVVKWAAGYNTHVAPGHWSDVCELVELLIADGNPAYVQLAADIADEAKMKDWQDNEVFGVSCVIRDLRKKLEKIRDDDGQIYEIRMRSRAASAIGHLGDKRPGVGIIEAVPKRPDIVWCGSGGVITAKGVNAVQSKAFPPEPFLIGVPSNREPSDRKDLGEVSFEVSFPQFRCTRIRLPFFISQYPITVAQYQLFVETGGYEEEQFWTKAGWNWRQGKLHEMADWYKEEYQKESFPISAPKKYGPIYQTPNHPQVGVSWFEARAYSNWLNRGETLHHILKKLGLPRNYGMEVHLPTEAEWELAARWNQKKAQADDRHYPWGDACSEAELSHRCNWSKTGINGTSAVGLFPKGNGDCGVADLSGNVWEWCQSKWKAPGNTWKGKTKEDEYNDPANDIDDENGNDIRVWRGGSWVIDLPEHLRCSYRDDCAPGFRSHNIGFRCVLVLVGPAPVRSLFSSGKAAGSPH